jgi:hypothetical protein
MERLRWWWCCLWILQWNNSLARLVASNSNRLAFQASSFGLWWLLLGPTSFFSVMLRNPVESDRAPIASSPLRPDAVSETAALAATGRRSWGLIARRLRCVVVV